ncbi:hypothetical protein GQ457_12G012750 [Hibiscus cannabinus]
MFDLAINTTLDPKTLFPDFCSLVYSGGLSRDLDEIFVEIQDSSASYHHEIKVVISPVNLVFAIFGVTEKRRCSFQSSTI